MEYPIPTPTPASTRHKLISRSIRVMFLSIVLVLISLTPLFANTLTANFADLTPGTTGQSITDGGITFSNLYVDSTGGTNVVGLGIGTTTDSGFGFSGTNYLTSGGDPSSFGNIYSFDISFLGMATNASLIIGAFGDPNESNTLTLEAFNGTNMVASSTYAGFATNGFGDVSGLLSASWSSGFTSMKLLVNVLDTDPNADFLTFGVNNVVVNTVPEPSTYALLFLAMTGGGLLYRHTRKRRDQMLLPIAPVSRKLM